MEKPKLPVDEKERMQDLKALNLLDTPITQYFERITRITKALFNVPIVAFSLVDQERQWFKSIQGLDVCETSREVSFCGHAIVQEDLFIVGDTLLDSRFFDNPLVCASPQIRFYAGYPIKSKNKRKIGTICIIDYKPRNDTAEDLAPLKDIAALIEDQLINQKNLYLHSELIQELDETERRSLTDSVTRLWNRGGIETILAKQMTLSATKNCGFGLALIDVDDFKVINDTYGHEVGDQALIHLSRLLIDSIRNNDAVGRWGGDEFLLILDIEDKVLLKNIVERLKNKIQSYPLHFDNKQIKIRLTIGLIMVKPIPNQDMGQLIKLADVALYQGKDSGKDKIVFLDY